jgi:hypothetical protein
LILCHLILELGAESHGMGVPRPSYPLLAQKTTTHRVKGCGFSSEICLSSIFSCRLDLGMNMGEEGQGILGEHLLIVYP